MPARPVTIVCVSNDLNVRRACLDRSIEDLGDQAPDTEYIPVDNSDGTFASAGAALNHAARQARHDYVVFVHQDVYLHSLRALQDAARAMAADPSIGLHGAFGVTSDGRGAGQVRDRVLLIGERLDAPLTVDSLDEVLFMIARADVLEEPLSEDPELAWHAYAVEYGLRMRARGRRVTAGHLPLTHNSRSRPRVSGGKRELVDLDVAHGAIAAGHPDDLPLQTSCGPITPNAGRPAARGPLLSEHRWRYPWLRGSVAAHRARRVLGDAPVVLADIRRDIDTLLDVCPAPLDVINQVPRPLAPGDPYGERLELARGGHAVTYQALSLPQIRQALETRDAGRSVLITDLGRADLGALRELARGERLVGYGGGQFWLLVATDLAVVPEWTARRAQPLGMAPVA